MIIKILGTWCPSCKLLLKTTEEAAKTLDLKCKIIYVTDMSEIMDYDIMSLPALVIDEKVIFAGKIPQPQEMIDILTHQKLSKDFLDGSCCSGKDSCSIDCWPTKKQEKSWGYSCGGSC